MRVLCINADKLPPGAEVKEGHVYDVVSKFANNFDQIVYIIDGVQNEGKTQYGLPWIGYRADRFVPLTDTSVEAKEKKYETILN
jgi:hypothetical protein